MAKSTRTQTPPSKPSKSTLIPKHLTKEEFGRRLYKLMLERGWRQADFARAADLPRNAISVYLRGVSFPNPDSLKKLAKALEIEPSVLLPNYIENVIDRSDPELEFRVSGVDPKKAWLRVNRLVSISTAVKVMALIEADNDTEASN